MEFATTFQQVSGLLNVLVEHIHRAGGHNHIGRVRFQLNGTSDVAIPTCNAAGATPATGYQANADAIGAIAGRYFATDKRGTIFQSASALANPIPAGSTPYR